MNNLLLLLGGHWSSDLQWLNKLTTLSLFFLSLFCTLFLSVSFFLVFLQPPTLHPPPNPPTHSLISFWTGSLVLSQWIWAHFVCSDRSWAPNWLSNFYIIRYRQVGGARTVERSSGGTLASPGSWKQSRG